MSTKRSTGWYWLPAEPGDKVPWHLAFYDAERDRMWVAQCNGSGWRPSVEALSHPAPSPLLGSSVSHDAPVIPAPAA